MSAVIEKPSTTKSKTKPAAAPRPANAMEEIDMLVQPIAKRISPLAILFSSWPWGEKYPGHDELIEVDNLLTDLSRPLEEWQEKDEPPRPMTGKMLDSAEDRLQWAISEIEGAQGFDPGQRCLLLLVAREALRQIQALGRVFKDACLGHLAGLQAMAEDANGKPLTGNTPFEITAETRVIEAGSEAAKVASWLCYDIEQMAQQVTLLSDAVEDSSDGSNCSALLRCYGTRIEQLNQQVRHFIDGNPDDTMDDVHRAFYGRAKYYVGPDHD